MNNVDRDKKRWTAADIDANSLLSKVTSFTFKLLLSKDSRLFLFVGKLFGQGSFSRIWNISSGEKKTFQTEFIGFSHPETGAHMADILIDEAIKVVIPY